MKKTLLVIVIICSLPSFLFSQEGAAVWREFIKELRSGNIGVEKLMPLEELGDSFKPTLLTYLDSLKAQASAEDWSAVPEVIQRGDIIICLVPWSTRKDKITYSFKFKVIDEEWYFQHLEAIFIRLDKVGAYPVSVFPDIDEHSKAWIRQETYWSFIVNNIYNPLVSQVGTRYVLDLLKDGKGYILAARTWVPFLDYSEAFILYLCWEQSKLNGNYVSLLKRDPLEAIVEMETIYFALYESSAHLRTKISIEEYKFIFETIWYDRAKYSGWNLEIEYYENNKVRFHFWKGNV